MNKKKIGVLIYANPDYYPPTINAVHLLAKHFDIVLIGRNQESPHWQYPSNVEIHRLGQNTSLQERIQAPAHEKIREYIKFITQSRQLLKSVSLIYAYDAFAYNAAYLSRFSLSQSVSLIYQSHEVEDCLPPLTSLSGWVHRAERAWIHGSTFVVFPDKDRASFYKKVTSLKKEPIIIPNFPRTEFFKSIPNWASTIPTRFHRREVLLQGAISLENSMLDILESITFTTNPVNIKFIGKISENNLQAMRHYTTAKSINSYVKYFTPVPYCELQSHTWNASVGLCLYKNLGLNYQANVTATNKIYEYIACGLPVIVSDFPNYREYFSGESWVHFADPDNPQSIASAIQHILSDFENYRRMCLAARNAFEQKFNYESVFLPMLSQIKELVNAHQ